MIDRGVMPARSASSRTRKRCALLQITRGAANPWSVESRFKGEIEKARLFTVEP